jgi:hypothetical protein
MLQVKSGHWQRCLQNIRFVLIQQAGFNAQLAAFEHGAAGAVEQPAQGRHLRLGLDNGARRIVDQVFAMIESRGLEVESDRDPVKTIPLFQDVRQHPPCRQYPPTLLSSHPWCITPVQAASKLNAFTEHIQYSHFCSVCQSKRTGQEIVTQEPGYLALEYPPENPAARFESCRDARGIVRMQCRFAPACARPAHDLCFTSRANT